MTNNTHQSSTSARIECSAAACAPSDWRRKARAHVGALCRGLTLVAVCSAAAPAAAIDLLEVYRLALREDAEFRSAGAANRAAQESRPQALALLRPDISVNALTSGTYQNSVRPGQALNVQMELHNSGYAAPINPRPVNVVLQSTTNKSILLSVELTDVDIRTWTPENSPIRLNISLDIPADDDASNSLPTGTYELLLHLPDAAPTLTARPEYAIRLANTNVVWDAATGMNGLGMMVRVIDSIQ